MERTKLLSIQVERLLKDKENLHIQINQLNAQINQLKERNLQLEKQILELTQAMKSPASEKLDVSGMHFSE